MAASVAYVQKNMLSQQNRMFSWLVEALVVVPYLAEQCDDRAERGAIFGKSLNERERDVRRCSPLAAGDTGESNAPRIEFGSREQNRNCDLRFPVHALRVEIGAGINSLGSRHSECCWRIAGTGDHDTFVRLHVA